MVQTAASRYVRLSDVHVECSAVVNFTPIAILVYLLMCVCFVKKKLRFKMNVINEIHNTKQKQTRQFGFEGTYCQERKHFPVYKRSKVFIWCVVRFAR